LLGWQSDPLMNKSNDANVVACDGLKADATANAVSVSSTLSDQQYRHCQQVARQTLTCVILQD